MTKAEFKKLVENGPVILDGATGTNLQKAGMPVGVCPEQWILENPDIMIKLQEDYVAAGTDILYAPTFTANRIKLEEYGLADRLEEMNRELIALSQKAAQGKALVAADMTMTGQQLYPIGDLMFEDLVDVYKEQAEVVADAGADLFVVETMMSLQECRAAVIAIREVCDLPIMVSLTYNPDGRTLYGTDPATATVVLQSLGADAIGINCSTGPEDMIEPVGKMAEYALICAVGALISMVGDLAASAIKRNQNIKDYGKLIPGHGGILDRFDSVIITAPVIYYLAKMILGI